jgi:hypothetical protein
MGHLDRATHVTTAVLGDLDSVLIGFNAPVNNIRYATLQAALVGVARDIDLGRNLAGRSLDSLAVAEDRLYLAQINRLGENADEKRRGVYDANLAELLGGSPRQLQALRADGLAYGDAAVVLALSVETGKSAGDLESGFTQWKTFRAHQANPGRPVSWVDGIQELGGSQTYIEIMLRQVAEAMREEAGVA